MSAIRSGGGGWDPTGAAPSPPGHLQDSYDSSRLASKILPTSTSMGHSATTSLHADAHAFPVAVLVVVLTWWILLACTPTSLSPYESRPPSLPSFESGFPKHRRDYALSEYTSTHSGCAVSSYSPRTYSPACGTNGSFEGSCPQRNRWSRMPVSMSWLSTEKQRIRCG
eukprot:CAMPEP_0172002032 /NCGR_PEP_ID=MMETSP1041-20130122/3192_1 /TAXON_ID=464988 /ORGANISM="Hemiselmis andersenii, Strain CCMP439" /LENGTH=167 /DNA_ID=CAMNT_0012655723 /DNA_START=656 /DNA_END=1159 /DNA_ORIENTATION=-